MTGGRSHLRRWMFTGGRVDRKRHWLPFFSTAPVLRSSSTPPLLRSSFLDCCPFQPPSFALDLRPYGHPTGKMLSAKAAYVLQSPIKPLRHVESLRSRDSVVMSSTHSDHAERGSPLGTWTIARILSILGGLFLALVQIYLISTSPMLQFSSSADISKSPLLEPSPWLASSRTATMRTWRGPSGCTQRFFQSCSQRSWVGSFERSHCTKLRQASASRFVQFRLRLPERV